MHEIADIACNFTSDRFDNDLDEVIDRAIANHITKFGLICSRLRDIDKLLEIYNRYSKNMFFTIGVHPHHANEINEEYLEKLKEAINVNNPHAIGETGLDFHYSQDSKKDQIKSLIQHIEVAKEADLPVIIHARNADKEIGKILSEQYHKSSFKCVMHCFSSGSYLAEEVLDLGFYLSMSGIITFKNSQSLREIFAKVPIDKILVETDSPYLAPVPHRGKSNEPAFVSFIAKKGAEVLNVDEDFFRTQTTKNFFTLFKKAF